MVAIFGAFIAVSVAFFILGAVILYGQTGSMFNTCWKDVIKGFRPFDAPIYKYPRIILDSQCVDSITFTPDVEECKTVCRSFHDAKEANDCASACKLNEDGDTRSYIVALPRHDSGIGGTIKRVSNIFKSGASVFEGNPAVFYIPCELEDIDEAIVECEPLASGTGSVVKWTCTPSEEDEEASTYYIMVERSDDAKTCVIKSL